MNHDTFISASKMLVSIFEVLSNLLANVEHV